MPGDEEEQQTQTTAPEQPSDPKVSTSEMDTDGTIAGPSDRTSKTY